MLITIELTDNEINEIYRWLSISKLCGSFVPDHDPSQALAVKVLVQIKKELLLSQEKTNVPCI